MLNSYLFEKKNMNIQLHFIAWYFLRFDISQSVKIGYTYSPFLVNFHIHDKSHTKLACEAYDYITTDINSLPYWDLAAVRLIFSSNSKLKEIL